VEGQRKKQLIHDTWGTTFIRYGWDYKICICSHQSHGPWITNSLWLTTKFQLPTKSKLFTM